MSVDQLFSLIKYAAAKNQGLNISPDDFNNILMPMAQASYLDYLKGEYQKYQLRRPISVVEFGQNQMIRQSLSPFIYGTNLTLNSSGVAQPPSDHEFNDAMWSIYGYYNIKFIQQDRLASYINSSIDPISENPVYLINHEGFQFFPARPFGENQVRMSYVRTPPSIFWAYTLDTHGRPVYDPVNSQQPVWADTDIYEVVVRALALVGVRLQTGAIIQYANEIKSVGQ